MTAFQVLFIAGITNIVFLLLVLASCRCMDFSKITRVFTRNQKFFNMHCYYWYGFIISVLVHTVMAFYLFGWPF